MLLGQLNREPMDNNIHTVQYCFYLILILTIVLQIRP